MSYERKFIPHAHDCKHCAAERAERNHQAHNVKAFGCQYCAEREIEAVIASGVSERGTK